MTTMDQPHDFLPSAHWPQECMVCPFGPEAVIHHGGNPAGSSKSSTPGHYSGVELPASRELRASVPLSARVRQASLLHPDDERPWPHGLLHEAAEELDRLQRQVTEVQEQSTKDVEARREAELRMGLHQELLKLMWIALQLSERGLQRWHDGGPAKRIPAQPTDADLLLHRVRSVLSMAELVGLRWGAAEEQGSVPAGGES